MQVRDKAGRFVKGNPGNPNAKGRPPKKREERYYQIAVNAIPFNQWRAIVRKAAEKAERGDVAALRFLADYLLGKPVQEVKVDQPGSFLVIAWDDADDTATSPSSGPDDGSEEQGEA